MGRSSDQGISRTALWRYLARVHGATGALELTRLREVTESDIKEYGYGAPIKATFRTAAGPRTVVLRTMTSDPFDHDRRSDRIAQMVLAYDTFESIPKHIRPIDVGLVGPHGDLQSIRDCTEPFLVSDYVEGDLYATDLASIHPKQSDRNIQRARTLARYLADLHRVRTPSEAYTRSIRSLVGHGEGIFGLCDSYPPDDNIASPERLESIEKLAINWRWRLRAHADRSRRTHGDFHPFNILFREGTDFSVLDCSRGGMGEPADDVTCLSVNYLFFALIQQGSFTGPYRDLWSTFWRVYLEETGDDHICSVVAPFFAWRLLVLASPIWYPNVASSKRHTLLRFAERLLAGAEFDPNRVEDLLE